MGSCGLIIRVRVEELLKTVVTGVSTTMGDVIVVKCYKSGSGNCSVSFVKFLLAVRLNLSKLFTIYQFVEKKVVNRSSLWCYWLFTSVEESLF